MNNLTQGRGETSQTPGSSDDDGGQFSAPTAPDANRQLVAAKDERWQRWGLYGFLMLMSAAFLLVFLALVVSVSGVFVISAWFGRIDEAIIEVGKLPAGVTALIGAIVASLVAVPLSLCIALAKLVSPDKVDKPVKDSAAFTSAFFELGKAFAQGISALKKPS